MQEPTTLEKMKYVADMAEQLGRLCQKDAPMTAAMLLAAAKTAREREPVRKG